MRVPLGACYARAAGRAPWGGGGKPGGGARGEGGGEGGGEGEGGCKSTNSSILVCMYVFSESYKLKTPRRIVRLRGLTRAPPAEWAVGEHPAQGGKRMSRP